MDLSFVMIPSKAKACQLNEAFTIVASSQSVITYFCKAVYFFNHIFGKRYSQIYYSCQKEQRDRASGTYFWSENLTGCLWPAVRHFVNATLLTT